MRKLSNMILLSALACTPLLVSGCGDDDSSDNPGGGATTSDAGEDSGGKSSTAGKGGAGGSSGKGGSGKGGSGGTVTTDGGSDNEPVAGADSGDAGGGGAPPVSVCDLDALEDAGAIPVDANGDIAEDTILEGGKSYTFDGATRVLDGATLTVEPCVKIRGESPTAVLGVMPGGKLEAAGQVDAPIVFTSSKEAGERLPGDWGGLIILGNARVNQPSPKIEGLVEATGYGSDNDDSNDESSGTLEYVRVEFVGRDIDGAGNESNGITFGGVGSGTVIDHVMVSSSIDDCFEWFGGTVDATHLIALNCDDDMFDADFGFSGKVQYAFGRQFESSAEDDSNGFEMDTSNTVDIDPLTTAKWSNITLCGANTGTAPAKPRVGAVLRRQVAGSIVNAIFTGFDTAAFSVRNTDKDPPTAITLTSSLVFGNGEMYDGTHDASATWFEDQAGNVDADNAPRGFDCYSNPPTPADEDIEGVDPGAGFDKAEFKGAVSVTDNWMTGAWVDWSED
jgi:hypothetical protein